MRWVRRIEGNSGRLDVGHRTPLGRVCLVLAVCFVVAHSLGAKGPPRARLDNFADRWLDDVATIALDEERRRFIELETVAQQELFIRHFWRARATEKNLRFRENLRAARELRSRSLERQQVAVLVGVPVRTRSFEGCDLLRPLEVWDLRSPVGADPSKAPTVVFVRSSAFDPRTARVWNPGRSSELVFGGGVETVPELMQRLSEERCLGAPVLTSLRRSLKRASSVAELREIYRWEPDDPTWLRDFDPTSADMDQFRDATLSLVSVGRHNRSVIVRGVVKIDASRVLQTIPGHVSDEVEILGDVRRGSRLVDSFRIIHRLAGALPDRDWLGLDFHRRLFPGDYSLSIRVADRTGIALLRETRPLRVPSLTEEAPPPPGRRRGYGSLTRDEVIQLTTFPSVELLPPPPRLLGPRLAVRAVTTGANIRSVEFRVDDGPPVVDDRPPYLSEIELGAAERTVRVRALDSHGNELAEDTRTFESGPVSFTISIGEPPRAANTRVPVQVRVPADRQLVELSCFHNDRLVEKPSVSMEKELGRASCPWPDPGLGLVYLRVLARLDTGDAVEDLAFVSETPDSIDVSLAELFVSALDGEGRSVPGLLQEDFKVFVGDRAARIDRFGTVEHLPLAVAIMLDTSSSMSRAVGLASRSAQGFFERVLRDQDQASLLAFNHDVRVLSRFSDDRESLARSTHGLRSWGSTRLYDAIGFGLHGFAGTQGRRALVVLSDGGDTDSDLDLGDVEALANQAGVVVFPVSLGQSVSDSSELERLASRTGGRSFVASSVGDLDRIYREIEEILRLQYALVVEMEEADLDLVRIELRDPGLRARVQGYLP